MQHDIALLRPNPATPTTHYKNDDHKEDT
ncbi:hypothetical protein CCACVL1_20100 [Corchorus capsularis]|uniref:Uncharacterized protein n=1 Tax=Corchorus capsularis TaxID=210143 RepID=A0A1R3HCW4_COCAP|nr:hypothetical protein CCACVL1_20100 [Corchorus capsularis]